MAEAMLPPVSADEDWGNDANCSLSTGDLRCAIRVAAARMQRHGATARDEREKLRSNCMCMSDQSRNFSLSFSSESCPFERIL